MGNQCCHPTQNVRIDDIWIDPVIYEGDSQKDAPELVKKQRVNRYIKDSNIMIDPEINKPFIGDIYKRHRARPAPHIVHYNGSKESQEKMISEINPYYVGSKKEDYLRSKSLYDLNDVSSLKSDMVYSEVRRLVLDGLDLKISHNGISTNPEEGDQLGNSNSKIQINDEHTGKIQKNFMNSSININLDETNH